MNDRIVAGALILSLFSACTATIHRVGAPNLEGQIVGSDDQGLEIASDQGTAYRVPRESIADVDHPGNVLAVMGAAAIVLGGLVAITQRGSDQDQRSNLGPGLVISSVGFGMLLGGLIPYSASRGASRTFAEARLPVRALPGETARPATSAPPPPLAPLPADDDLAALPPSFSDSLLTPPLSLSDDLLTMPAEPSPSAEPMMPASGSSARPPAPFEKKPPPILFKPAPPAPPPPAGGR